MPQTLSNLLLTAWSRQRPEEGQPPGSVWDLASTADNHERVFDGRAPLYIALIGEEQKTRVFALVEDKAYLLQIALQGQTPRLHVAHLGSLEGGFYVEELGDDDVGLLFSHLDLPGLLEVRFGASNADEFKQLRKTLREWGEAPSVFPPRESE